MRLGNYTNLINVAAGLISSLLATVTALLAACIVVLLPVLSLVELKVLHYGGLCL